MKTMTINTRIDEERKKQAEELAKSLGMNLSDAVSIFISQFIKHRGLPFEVKEQPYHPSVYEDVARAREQYDRGEGIVIGQSFFDDIRKSVKEKANA